MSPLAPLETHVRRELAFVCPSEPRLYDRAARRLETDVLITNAIVGQCYATCDLGNHALFQVSRMPIIRRPSNLVPSISFDL